MGDDLISTDIDKTPAELFVVERDHPEHAVFFVLILLGLMEYFFAHGARYACTYKASHKCTKSNVTILYTSCSPASGLVYEKCEGFSLSGAMSSIDKKSYTTG